MFGKVRDEGPRAELGRKEMHHQGLLTVAFPRPFLHFTGCKHIELKPRNPIFLYTPDT